MQYVWPLITLVSLVFSFSAVYQWAVDSSHFSLHFDSILSPKAPKYFILNVLKRSLILDQLAADSFEEECRIVAY